MTKLLAEVWRSGELFAAGGRGRSRCADGGAGGGPCPARVCDCQDRGEISSSVDDSEAERFLSVTGRHRVSDPERKSAIVRRRQGSIAGGKPSLV